MAGDIVVAPYGIWTLNRVLVCVRHRHADSVEARVLRPELGGGQGFQATVQAVTRCEQVIL